jgi:hypothetical protein
MERWLPVVGYEGIYEVSNRGIVKSLARRMGNEPGKRARETSRENEQEKSTGRLSTRSTMLLLRFLLWLYVWV